MMPPFGADLVKATMRSDELKEFLKSDEKFDVCIMELFGDEALLVSNIISYSEIVDSFLRFMIFKNMISFESNYNFIMINCKISF